MCWFLQGGTGRLRAARRGSLAGSGSGVERDPSLVASLASSERVLCAVQMLRSPPGCQLLFRRLAPVLLCLFAAAHLGAQEATQTDRPGKRPNIVFVFSDDHATNAIGAYGGRLAGLDPTPAIDRLASQGMLFRNSYCTNSICGPSRAVILTGYGAIATAVAAVKIGATRSQSASAPPPMIAGPWRAPSSPPETPTPRNGPVASRARRLVS